MAKPVCSKCGVAHWRFVKCADAATANAEDAAKEAAAERNKVIPEYRNDRHREWGSDRLRNYRRSGANTFWRNDNDPPKAA